MLQGIDFQQAILIISFICQELILWLLGTRVMAMLPITNLGTGYFLLVSSFSLLGLKYTGLYNWSPLLLRSALGGGQSHSRGHHYILPKYTYRVSQKMSLGEFVSCLSSMIFMLQVFSCPGDLVTHWLSEWMTQLLISEHYRAVVDNVTMTMTMAMTLVDTSSHW